MGSVRTESNSKSAEVDLKRAAATSSLARVALRSPAAKAVVPPIATANPRIRKNLTTRIDLALSSFWSWTPKAPVRKPEAREGAWFPTRMNPLVVRRLCLPVRPDLPRGRIAAPVTDKLPALHVHGIPHHRFHGFFEGLLDCRFGGGGRNIHLRSLQRHDQPVPAVAHDHDRLDVGSRAARLVAIVPQPGSDEDERQDEGDHYVVVKTAARIGPVEIALQYLGDRSLRGSIRAVGKAGRIARSMLLRGQLFSFRCQLRARCQ